MFFLGFLGVLPKETSIVLHQLPDQQESIDCRDTVGNQAGDVFTLSASFALDEGLVPKSCELGVILLDLVNQFFLAETDLLKRAEFLSGFFLNW